MEQQVPQISKQVIIVVLDAGLFDYLETSDFIEFLTFISFQFEYREIEKYAALLLD